MSTEGGLPQPKQSPSTFTTVRKRSKNQSIASTKAMSLMYASIPTAVSTITMVTSPADGIAAAPTAARVAVNAMTKVSAISSGWLLTLGRYGAQYI